MFDGGDGSNDLVGQIGSWDVGEHFDLDGQWLASGNNSGGQASGAGDLKMGNDGLFDF